MLGFASFLPAAPVLWTLGFFASRVADLGARLGAHGNVVGGGASGVRMGLPPLSERVFLITGSTDGTGRATAALIAKDGATVLIHGRNATKIEATVKELQGIAPDPAKIHGFQADLALMSEVKKLASEVTAKFPVIHGFLSNAYSVDEGVEKKVTAEGYEHSCAVNIMAPFLLSSLLMESVKASGAGRFIIHSSATTGLSEKLGDLQLESDWSPYTAYKLGNLAKGIMAIEMHRRYGNAPELCFHTTDPGTVNTELLKELDMNKLNWIYMKDVDWLTKDAYQEHSGGNYGGGKGTPEEGKKLWDDLVALTGAQWPEPAVQV